MNPNFRDILAELSAAEAEFLVVGAYALGVHGLLRSTGDLDIWVRPTLENAAKDWQALVRFPAPLSEVNVQDFATPDIVFRMGIPPNQIDILTSLSGVAFEQAWANHVVHEVQGISVPVIGVHDQIQNKRSTGRAKDMVVADWL